MVQMTKDVWGGDDYVPFVWDEWMNDGSGVVLVAVLDGRTVGLQHIDVHPDGGAWFEGIRVEPGLQNQGIGSVLLSEGIDWARRMGCSVVRLSTSSQNPASNRMAERAGLVHIATFRTLQGDPGPKSEVAGVRLGLPWELDSIVTFLEDRPHPFYAEGWTVYRLTPERVGLLLAMKSLAVFGGDEVEAVAIATSNGRQPHVGLGLLTGSHEGMAAIGSWLRSRAAAASLEMVRGHLEETAGAFEALHLAGFRTDFEHAMLLRERVLSPSS